MGKTTKDMGKYPLAKVKWGSRIPQTGNFSTTPPVAVPFTVDRLIWRLINWCHLQNAMPQRWTCQCDDPETAGKKLEPYWMSTQIQTVTPTSPTAQSCLDVRRWICWCLEFPCISWSMMLLGERYKGRIGVPFVIICWLVGKTLGDTGYPSNNQSTTRNICDSDRKSPQLSFCYKGIENKKTNSGSLDSANQKQNMIIWALLITLTRSEPPTSNG